jgi:hypothetical protein
MKRIPKKSRTAKKDLDSSASKSTTFASGCKLSKQNALPNISTQQEQGDENVQNNNLVRYL